MNYVLKQEDTYKLPVGEQVYAFYESVDGNIINVVTDTIQEMVTTLNSILEKDAITPQRIVQANKPTTLYGNPYISNVVTYYVDRKKGVGSRFIIAYKSIWDSYTDTQKRNRLKKL